jgi:hypothetical protein
MSELENGRLVRLLTKMGFINERPEYVLHNRLLAFYPIPTKPASLVLGSDGHIVGQKRVIDTSSNSSETTSSTKWTRTSTRS